MANCGGPDGFKWDGERCVSSSGQTSCDSVAGETCWYAFLIDGGKVAWFSGRFIAGQGLKISDPSALASVGINAGDVIDRLNGVLLSGETILLAELAPFTETNPATVFSATHLLGKTQLTLTH